jgi:polyribonucleotide nucleotidyltransferase
MRRGSRRSRSIPTRSGSSSARAARRSARSRRTTTCRSTSRRTGVVRTTDFGAFVELKKGTDGLLHVSNVGPGRLEHIEQALSRGDTVDVLVQEVDKARGRIGLKLVAKHEDGGLVTPEALMERAKSVPAPAPRERDDDRRGGRDRGPRRDRRPRRDD